MKKGIRVEHELVADVIVDQNISLVEAEDGIEWIYKALGCGTFDVAYTTIGGYDVNVYCDDEGLYATGNLVADYNGAKLAGTVLIAKGVDAEGETIWFTDEAEIEAISLALRTIKIIGRVK